MTGRPASDARPRGSLRRSGPLPPLPRHGSARRMVAALPCRRRPPPSAAGRPCGPRALRARLVRENGKAPLRQPDHLHHLVTVARLVRAFRAAGPGWRLSAWILGGFRPGGAFAFLAMPSARALRCNRRSLTLPAISAAIPIASGRWRSLRAPLAPGESGAQDDRRSWRSRSYLSLHDLQAWQIRDSPRQGTAATGLLAA